MYTYMLKKKTSYKLRIVLINMILILDKTICIKQIEIEH